MNMHLVKLKDLVDIYLGVTHTPEYTTSGVPFLSVKDISGGKIDFDNCKYISESEYDSLPKGAKPQAGDLLFCRVGTIGKPILIPKNTPIFGSFVSLGFLRNKDEEMCDLNYLKYWMGSENFFEQVKANVKGASQINLNTGWLSKFDVPMVPLYEQKEVNDKLDKVQSVIELRKQQLQQLDELVKARFVELFGECKNKVRLGDCCEVHARIGWQALTKNEHMKNGEYMLVTGTDFKDGEINYSTCVYVAKERYEMDKHIILKNDDVLITKDGTIGKVAVVHNLPKPATLNAGVFVVRPDDRFNKTFIANVFKGTLFSDFVESSKTGATIKHLNQKHLVEFMIPVPTINEQEAFASFSNQIDKSKFVVQKALDEAQTLFDSLMQEYFG